MGYYLPCPELDECNRLIETYFEKGDYEPCFSGHLTLAERGYPLAMCQVGYFYWEGLGTEKDEQKAFAWTQRGALANDRDAQYNLACFYETGVGCVRDEAQANLWYARAAAQGHDLAIAKCGERGVDLR